MRPLSIRRRSAPLFVSMAVAALLIPVTQLPGASATPNVQSFAVSHLTAEQHDEVQMLRQALAERNIDQSGIGVFALPTTDGLTTIITRRPEEFSLRPQSGGLYELTRIESALPGADLSTPADGIRAASANGSEWVRSNADCDIYSTEGFARTQCFEINRQAGDTDAGRTFWQYTAEATGHSKGGRKMDRIWIERKPAETSAAQQFDGIPEPKEARNKADNCVQETEGISIQSGAPVQIGFSKNWSRMTCETYRPKMYDDEGHWATIWEGNPTVSEKDSRHVLFTMPVKTAEGALPDWVRLNGQHTRR